MTKIILIAGGTASGKTTITAEFAKQQNALVIPHDRYYKDIHHPNGFNFDEPAALDNSLLAKHIRLLKDGKPAQVPIYDFSTHCRLPQREEIHPRRLIIIEGILTLATPEIRELGDLLIYVDAPDDIRLLRRIQRDVVKRGRNVGSILKQYINTVRPMHHQHVLPSKQFASIHLDGTMEISKNVLRLSNYIKNHF